MDNDDATGDATGWKETHCKTSLSFSLFLSFFLFFERRRAVELQAREGKGREEEEEGAGEEGDPRPAFESKIGRVPRVVTGIFP